VCQELIFNSVATGAIEEVQFKDGQVIDRQWILHHFEYNSFCIFGFPDNFVLPTAHPANLATRREGFHENIQRAFYLGYFCKHGLTAQVVYLTIGLIGSIFITGICQDNNGELNKSGLMMTFVGSCLATEYMDFSHAFTVMAYLQIIPSILPGYVNPTPEQEYMNLKFASERHLSNALAIIRLTSSYFGCHILFTYLIEELRCQCNAFHPF
jgi:hypothetical protein